MNYTSTKETGAIIKKICSLFNEYDPIDVAKNLPCTVSEYIVATRFAFIEIKAGLRMHKELLIQVIDKYVSSEEVRKVLFTHPFFKSEETRMDFIEANVDNQFCLMQKMRCDYIALDLLAHPECYKVEEYEESAMNYIESEIAPTKENCLAFDWSLIDIHNKKQLKAQQEQPVNKSKYIIAEEEMMLEIFDLLKSEVIYEDTKMSTFVNAIERADVSTIIVKPKKITKFRTSLSQIKYCIKTDQVEWFRDACASINTTPHNASSNNVNTNDWYEKLQEILGKHIKK